MDKLQYLSLIGRCHHVSLQFSVDFKPNPVQKFCRTVWKYSNADWEKANDCLSSFQLEQNQDVDCAWKFFHDMFMQTMSECIPQKTISCKAVNGPPWLTAELRKLIRKKHQMFKNWKSTKRLDIYSRYKQLRNRLSNQVKREKLFYLSSLADSGVDRGCWIYLLQYLTRGMAYVIINASTLTTLMSLKIGLLVCTLNNLASFLILLSAMLKRFIN